MICPYLCYLVGGCSCLILFWAPNLECRSRAWISQMLGNFNRENTINQWKGLHLCYIKTNPSNIKQLKGNKVAGYPRLAKILISCSTGRTGGPTTNHGRFKAPCPLVQTSTPAAPLAASVRSSAAVRWTAPLFVWSFMIPWSPMSHFVLSPEKKETRGLKRTFKKHVIFCEWSVSSLL